MKRHIGDIQVHLRDAKKMQDEDRVRLLTNELNQSKIELETAAGATNRGQVEVITARKKSMDEDHARARDERDSELRAREEAKIRDDQKMRELRALGVPLEGRPNEKAPARPRTPARIGVPITPEPPRDPHVLREPLDPRGPHEPQNDHEVQALRSELKELRAAVESLRAEIEATRRAKR
jgi:hypothetical protein